MAGFKLYTGNRLEHLADAVSEVVAKPLSSPFESEVIVVQSRGMERWLSIALSKRLGIWANCRYPFPDKFVWEIFSSFRNNTDITVFSPRTMVWRIMGILPDYIDTPEFYDLRQYIGDDKNHLKMLQLSERIADTFDRYTVYRPEMIMDWDKGLHTGWQPILWRALIRGFEHNHRSAVWRDFLKSIDNGTLDVNCLPERICVFGIPSLPNYHFAVIFALSGIIDVHFFLMNPSKEYWGDIITEKKATQFAASDMHFETGNPLLASMGKLGRDFFNTILSVDYDDYQSFSEPDNDSVLTSIQSDIYNLKWRGRDTEKTPVHPQDISVQIHSCHSPMREVEVLYDNLLYLFEKYKDLEPRDILVMTPDIETYAPYISAIFEGYRDEKKKIPYSIADRGALCESPVIDAFLKIIRLCNGRFGASEVADVLDAPCIQERFGIKAEDIETILRWIKDTQIRWGIDGRHRQNFGVLPFEANSWQFGIRRLLLGYAMFSKDNQLFHGILPYNDMEGNETEILGQLLEFLSSLFYFADVFKSFHTLAEWAILLENLLTQFIAVNDDSESDIQIIRDVIKDLGVIQTEANFNNPVSFDVIIYHLTKNLNSAELSTGFITGGVTFCEMLPMRSIPFKVIGLIGMNNNAYPREYKSTGFDLIAHNPRPQDRSLRDEDRYLFLEAILSARLCLYISYTGQSIRDNSEIPPSVVVSELLDYIENGFEVAQGNILDFIVKKQRLQTFSPSYFTGGLLFSYSEEDCKALEAGIQKQYTQSPFIIKTLEEPASEWKNITINDLKRFYSHPSKYFLNYRLGIYFDDGLSAPEDDEPFELDNLDAFFVTTRMTEEILSKRDTAALHNTIVASGIIPPASPGEVALKDAFVTAKSFSDKLKKYNIEQKLQPLDIDINLAGFKISGRISNIYEQGMISYRCVKTARAKYLLETWIDHLVLNAAGYKSYPRNSMFVTINDAYAFMPVENSAYILQELLEIYFMGMKEPMKFFPQTSYKYAEQIIKGKTPEDALKSARNEWNGSEYSPNSESEDTYYRLCFEKVDPLDETFMDIAMKIYAPIITNKGKS